MTKLLVVEDDASAAAQLAARVNPGWAAQAVARSQILEAEGYDAAVLGASVRDPFEVCAELVRATPEAAVILLAETIGIAQAVKAMQRGAADLLPASISRQALRQSIERALAPRQLKRELRALRQEARSNGPFSDLLGSSEPMQALRARLVPIARSDATLLIEGESGTGKGRVARALHRESHRGAQPFVVISCGSVPARLFESELFGHVKGAFTGAEGDHEGLLLRADRGCVVLDEVADIPLDVQPKLLRALQERRLRPLGGRREVPFNVRVIATTHRDLAKSVKVGQFRQDLYYRLQVLGVRLPPLRERGWRGSDKQAAHPPIVKAAAARLQSGRERRLSMR